MLRIVTIEPSTTEIDLRLVDRLLTQGWNIVAITSAQVHRTSDWFNTNHYYHLQKQDE